MKKQIKQIEKHKGNSYALTMLISFVLIAFLSCTNENIKPGTSYDPNKPVELETFYPDSGGIATKMIISGSNFGTDTANIKVYFNDKRAKVVSTIGDKMYLVVPKLPGDADPAVPGDNCVIKVKIGDKHRPSLTCLNIKRRSPLLRLPDS